MSNKGWVVTRFTNWVRHLPSTVRKKSSESEPALFSALQVYHPTSSALTFVKCNTLSFSDRVKLSFDQCISGVEPFLIEQFRLTLSPVCTVPFFGPNTFTTGATKENLKRYKLGLGVHYIELHFSTISLGFPIAQWLYYANPGILNLMALTRLKINK